MLRIKEEIDLEELKNYGFIYDSCGRYYKFIYASPQGQSFEISIDCNDRIICGCSFFVGKGKYAEFKTIDDTLYDLVTNGLVEKVIE